MSTGHTSSYNEITMIKVDSTIPHLTINWLLIQDFISTAWSVQCSVDPILYTRISVRLSALSAVMSTNIQILEYSNKMAIEYYSYSYMCHFPSMNIFGYSFVDFWTTEYI